MTLSKLIEDIRAKAKELNEIAYDIERIMRAEIEAKIGPIGWANGRSKVITSDGGHVGKQAEKPEPYSGC